MRSVLIGKDHEERYDAFLRKRNLRIAKRITPSSTRSNVCAREASLRSARGAHTSCVRCAGILPAVVRKFQIYAGKMPAVRTQDACAPWMRALRAWC
jgi:hypothetical protein